MTIVVGVDPGLTGALAMYNAETRTFISVDDMPVWLSVIGRKKRHRVDAFKLCEWFETAKMLGAGMVVIEAVGGRPSQSASAGFVFGYSVGLVYMAAIAHRLPVETIPPATWKKLLSVPGKGKADDSAIFQRGAELFPEDQGVWRGPKGGFKLDRLEAMMLARFGADHILPKARTPMDDTETRLTYLNADTGS